MPEKTTAGCSVRVYLVLCLVVDALLCHLRGGLASTPHPVTLTLGTLRSLRRLPPQTTTYINIQHRGIAAEQQRLQAVAWRERQHRMHRIATTDTGTNAAETRNREGKGRTLQPTSAAALRSATLTWSGAVSNVPMVVGFSTMDVDGSCGNTGQDSRGPVRRHETTLPTTTQRYLVQQGVHFLLAALLAGLERISFKCVVVRLTSAWYQLHTAHATPTRITWQAMRNKQEHPNMRTRTAAAVTTTETVNSEGSKRPWAHAP